AAVFRLEKSFDTEAMERVLEAASEWLRAPGLEGLRKSFTDWVLKVLLPSRIRGVRFPELLDLEEVKAMLAESGFSWSDRWEREGMEKGLQEARGALLQDLERRFGPLPETILRRVDAFASLAELTKFSFRAGAASSLAELATIP
ncbi:MAG TPA: transposase, partial [Thermoanaerobaculia bacterium]|nr:transposase [Thermoanaerobaculia bacterium]